MSKILRGLIFITKGIQNKKRVFNNRLSARFLFTKILILT